MVAAPQYVIGVVGIAFIIQQIEAYYLAPRIMAEQANLDPLLVIVYTAIGFVIFGIVGALVAVPVMSAVHILLLHLVIEPYAQSLRQVHNIREEGLPVMKAEEPTEFDSHDQNLELPG